MFSHIVKLIWNRKRKNMLMILEIFISFIVLFAIISFSLEKYSNYQVPAGFEYKKVWVAEFRWETDTKEQVTKKFELISNELKNIPEIKAHSFASHSTPFSYSGSRDNVDRYGKKVYVTHLEADLNFTKVMGMNIVEGRHFNSLDESSKLPSVLINKQFAQDVMNNKKYLGKIENEIGSKGYYNMNVVGVYDFFQKQSPLTVPVASLLWLKPIKKGGFNSVFIRVNKNSTAELEEKIIKRIASVTKNWSIRFERLEVKRQKLVEKEMLKVYTYGIISTFLILNVALGLFGVLWFNIENRKSEIGLRRVFGAVSSSIQKQVLAETLILTFLGLLIGIFFAVQVPLLNLFDLETIIYVKAMIISSVFICIISSICAIYPSKIASTITPALVLHED